MKCIKNGMNILGVGGVKIFFTEIFPPKKFETTSLLLLNSQITFAELYSVPYIRNQK